MSGLPARAAQHEIDHLDGIVFIDRLSPTNLLSVKQALSDLESEFEDRPAIGADSDDDQIAWRLAELEAART